MRGRQTVILAMLGTLAAASASTQPAEPPPEVQAILKAMYLPRSEVPDSLALLPPAPAAGSATQVRDDAAAREAVAIRGSPRWKQAVTDADLTFPNVAGAFACALGVEVSEQATPRVYQLLQRAMADVALSTYPTKLKYQRVRPFVAQPGPTCTPDQEDFLRRDGSYPSGHSAVGWGWALVLAEAAPDRQNEVLARGRAFGQSRVICNVHWLSDTEERRVIAAATVARLHDQPEFRADVQAARSEIAAARAAGRKPQRDCEVEAAQLRE